MGHRPGVIAERSVRKAPGLEQASDPAVRIPLRNLSIYDALRVLDRRVGTRSVASALEMPTSAVKAVVDGRQTLHPDEAKKADTLVAAHDRLTRDCTAPAAVNYLKGLAHKPERRADLASIASGDPLGRVVLDATQAYFTSKYNGKGSGHTSEGGSNGI
jgi:hypothetical protein